MENSNLNEEDLRLISKIAELASNRYGLNYEKCYNITFFYFLIQQNKIKEDDIPIEYLYSTILLYKNPISSYIHYRTEIMYSKDEYAKAIKNAEIELAGGDDPRCPWWNV